ncbi:hypothetical protein EV664_107151 [Stakelama pacifica]|uniref:Uncharacterized protein n=1 Tax=Stakelama pacifica TaxID=517720 RepID=A0A4R6FJV1_9SPHN|nr:hypothetical protein EV664_107151 [Stakelama pacifica]
MSRSGHCDEHVAESGRGSVGLCFRKRRLVSIFPALIVKAYLMAPNRTRPIKIKWLDTEGVKPRSLVGSVAIGRLPNLAYPSTSSAALPARTERLNQPIGVPSAGFSRMLKHAAICSHRSQGAGETTAVVTRSIVLATPTRIVDARHSAPPLARRVCDNGMRPGITASITRLVPRINAVETEIAAIRFDVERRNGAGLIGHEPTP